MKLLYFFSIFNKYTLPNFKDFFRQACKESSNLVVLMQIKEQKQSIINLIKQIDFDFNIQAINFIAPDINDTIAPAHSIQALKNASGILVLGGNTHFYQKIYGNSDIGGIVNEKYSSGVPYAGVSAGAILSLRYNLLDDVALKPHFTEKRRFDELMKKMKKNKVKYGFGLDDNMSLKISDQKEIECIGKDSFYLFKTEDNQEYNFKIYKNLDKVSLR